MSDWNNLDEILDFAIEREQEAGEFYLQLAGDVEDPNLSTFFRDLARVEMGHKARLERIKLEGAVKSSRRKILDMQMADYLVDVVPSPGMDYQEALILAMKREQSAYKLYSKLAAITEEPLRKIFLSLAQDEASHKMHFELEYDERILTEN